MIAISSRSAAGEFRAVAGLVGGDGILALLDHLGEQRENLVVAQKIAAGLGARGDVLVLQRGVDEAQRGDAARILRLHRLFQRIVDLFAQAHGIRPDAERRNLVKSRHFANRLKPQGKIGVANA
ncbi:MAG: hypothetical protein WDM81_21595 [Rhizomicrobium sp.]